MDEELQTAANKNPELQKSFEKSGLNVGKSAEYQPSYKMIGTDKIPVSPAHGKMWEQRLEASSKARSTYEAAWKEAFAYYNNDQMSHRKSTDGTFAGNNISAKTLGNRLSETENIVFANTTVMLSILYAKNPAVEATPNNPSEQLKQWAVVCEQLINALMSMKSVPGINLKPKARRCILHALLTNTGYLKIGWTFKSESSEQAINDIARISKELETAKDIKHIEKLEGQLFALESKVDMLQPAGPYVKVVDPCDIYKDPTSQEDDLSDCNWIIERDYMLTSYITATYMKDSDNDSRKELIYMPTHVIGSEKNTVEDQVNSFVLIKSDEKDSTTKTTYLSNGYTEVFWCWDKITRRLYLYHCKDWKYPLWVWNDPYEFTDFFPYSQLGFHQRINGAYGKGEVTYYLDQQDAINEINDEIRKGRAWAKRNVFFDKEAINQIDVEQILSGPDGTAKGITIPEGKTKDDIIFSITPPGLKYAELFNKEDKYRVIDRISSVGEVMRGGQFKTNTTNQAVQSYQQSAEIRIDDKTDQIEAWLGDFAWKLLQLCVKNYTKEDVQSIIGMEAVNWQQVSPLELRTTMNLILVGGSTVKPSSQEKKRQALEVAQILGQFASASPAIIIPVLKLFQQAFDTIVISDDDWQMITETMMQSLSKAGGGPQQGQEQGGGIEEIIASLTPEQRQQVQAMLDQGVPPEQALQQVVPQ